MSWKMARRNSVSTSATLPAVLSSKPLSLTDLVCPGRDNRMNRIDPIRQGRRARLQDDGRLYLMQRPVAHRRHVGPARPGFHRRRPELLAAPGAEDYVGCAARHLQGVRHDAV